MFAATWHRRGRALRWQARPLRRFRMKPLPQLCAASRIPASRRRHRFASFHTFRIEQIYSNADGTVQFVVLRESAGANGENLLARPAIDQHARRRLEGLPVPQRSARRRRRILHRLLLLSQPESHCEQAGARSPPTASPRSGSSRPTTSSRTASCRRMAEPSTSPASTR